MAEIILEIDPKTDIRALFGDFDENIKRTEKIYNVSIVTGDQNVKIIGDDEDIEKAKKLIAGMETLLLSDEVISEQSAQYISDLIDKGREKELSQISSKVIGVTEKGRPIRAKTLGQKHYIGLMNENILTVAIGPAGTGKTYLAVAMAVTAFKNKEVDKIVLTRPAVEAGEKLGFLPGDLQMKVDPYLRPLYDALFEMMGAENFYKHLERGTIEVAPLAYMRGRTLEESFIILDEAQNTTPEQMKMFLTRLGQNSKIVITGDVTQIDLPISQNSGLLEAAKVLKDIKDIGISYLTGQDVVRHPLVGKIIQAYDEYYDSKERENIENKSNNNK